jgi:hypothetical protein
MRRIEADQNQINSRIKNMLLLKDDSENIDMVSDVSSLNIMRPYKNFPVK